MTIVRHNFVTKFTLSQNWGCFLLSKHSSTTDSDTTKSWFCVFDNPEEHGYEGTPQEIVDRILNEWCVDSPTRSCAGTYCVSATGLKHLHLVFEDVKTMRFSQIKKMFPSMHIEPTKGTKAEAEDYIKKKGKWAEEGEEVLYYHQIGEIKGARGNRKDLEILEELINKGYHPSEILRMSISYRRYEKFIKDAYFDKRKREMPFKKENKVFWHVGESGSGKTFVANKIISDHGEDSVYFVSDYSSGAMDLYNGEKVLFLDEFRGQIPFSVFLTWIGRYRVQIHARYTNTFALWDEVHIATVLPPEKVYEKMVSAFDQQIDTFAQLQNRIDYVVYHYKDSEGNYCQYEVPMHEYTTYENLKFKLKHKTNMQVYQRQLEVDEYGFIRIDDDDDLPFK